MEIKKKILQGWENKKKISSSLKILQPPHQKSDGPPLSSKFVDRSSVSNYSLRDTEGKLAIPQPHTNYMKNSFSYSGAVLWNSLPNELRQADSLSAFPAGCDRLFS